MSELIIAKLGPLAALVGTWEGDKGQDTAPNNHNRGAVISKFRETMVFEPMGPINNHDQELYGLKYATTARRIGVQDVFHEEIGYWLWDAREKQAMRCFMVPRGVTIIAGGTVEANAKSFKLSAVVGSETYGICSNKFLDKEFKTVRYDLTVTVIDSDHISYEENTQLKIKGQDKIFDHIDKNTLKRVGVKPITFTPEEIE